MHWTVARVMTYRLRPSGIATSENAQRKAEELCVSDVLLGDITSGISEGLNFGDCTTCRLGRIGRGKFICRSGKVSKRKPHLL